jgi:hypothetical protein
MNLGNKNLKIKVKVKILMGKASISKGGMIGWF